MNYGQRLGTNVDIDDHGNIALNATGTQPATGTLNMIELATSLSTGGVGNSASINLTTQVPTGTGSGTTGIIQLTSGNATPGNLTVGGTVNPTGLYVSNSQLLFNNAPVGGSGGSSITGGTPPNTGSVSVDTTTGNINVLGTGSSTFSMDALEVLINGANSVAIQSASGTMEVDGTTTTVSGLTAVNLSQGNPLASFNNLSLGPGDTLLETSGAITLRTVGGNPTDNIFLSVAPVTPGVICSIKLSNQFVNPGAGTGWVFTPEHLYLNGTLVV
jgi:hypothetical protein